MPVDPAALDSLLAAQGGFDAAYKKLAAMATALLRTYGSDTGARVVLRQYDPLDIVDAAFERILQEGFEPGENVYFLLRRHVRNRIRSEAKLVSEGKTVRVEGDPDSKKLYLQETDPTEQSAPDRAVVIDDCEYCISVMFRLMADVKDDPAVSAIATAITEGFRDPQDICDVTGLSRPEYDAAFKRLRRKFLGLTESEGKKK
jgi:hypothetical protein